MRKKIIFVLIIIVIIKNAFIKPPYIILSNCSKLPTSIYPYKDITIQIQDIKIPISVSLSPNNIPI